MVKMGFDGQFGDVKAKIDRVQAALNEIKESPLLKKTYKCLLAFGNFMNNKTKNMGYGFRAIDGLNKMKQSKSGDNMTDLLKYTITFLTPKDEKTNDFKDAFPDLSVDLKNLSEAARVETELLKQEVEKFAKGTAVAEEAVKKANKDDPKDSFYSVFSKWISDAKVKTKEITDGLASCLASYDALRAHLGEPIDSTPWEDFFGGEKAPGFMEFLESWKQAREDLEALKLEEEKKAKKAAYEKEQAEKKEKEAKDKEEKAAAKAAGKAGVKAGGAAKETPKAAFDFSGKTAAPKDAGPKAGGFTFGAKAGAKAAGDTTKETVAP